ncbi:adenylate/guanylate cyclase domain-containing protein [uncultured Tateyamaria sp.]|uniref:adenylate/guanylate cyclase domain-containing protein n=1 Tax=uncultured Tateyamaria sp. TaxID=455651 RepID=UPI0026389AA9|nr:adenylate/guanylate cyclase domain-containing protein [uncultured Tateyamaria sp.]
MGNGLAETLGPTDRGPKGSVRQLAAVLHADAVGFSRLMASDEAGTHERLVAWRSEIFERLVEHNGRIIGTAGDAVLAIFDSVVDALAAAIEIQAVLAKKNASLPAQDQLLFRIGLNIGDIILDGDDVFGNGVNVAARIEGLADPGGIAVSAVVRDQVGNKLPLSFESLGSHTVKNIDTPLEVFAVHDAADISSRPRRKTPIRPGVIAAILAALAIGGAGLFVITDLIPLKNAATTEEPLEDPAVEANVRPKIAVLPFENQSVDADGSFFSDGVTEDVIAALGRFSGLLVLSWSAVQAVDDADVADKEMVSQLGADYLVTGSVRRSADQIRLSVQISDATSGVLIWSDRYDEAVINLFDVQDRLTRQVVSALTVNVTKAEEARVAVAPTESLTAFDLVLRGRGLVNQISRTSNSEARDLFERAIALDASYADAFVQLGHTYLNDLKFGWTQWPQQAWDNARSNAEQAIKLDPFNARAYALKASTSKFSGRLAEAEDTINRSLDLNPNLADGHAERCSILMFAGRSEEAIGSAQKALEIDPFPRGDQINCPIVALYSTGQFEAVLEIARKYPLVSKDEAASVFVLAATHAMLGQDTEAKDLIDEGLSRYPFFNPKRFAEIFTSEDQREIILEGLRRAGVE